MLETAVLCARLFLDAILFFSQYSIPHSIISLVHRRTYRAVKSPETIVVVCAGFAGHQLALQLANRIPAGYRVVLIEKNSYFNFSWIVPRLSVVSGHDHKAFIPYEPSISSAAMGSIELRQGVVVSIDEESVTLQDGEQIRYSFLAIATGTYATPPSKIVAEDRAKGVGILRDSQDQIREANEICVIGGGAVGVEITADIKSYYPGKTVNLIHSRDLLLNRFGPKLHQATMKVFDQLGVNVFLGERPSIDDDAPSEIVLKSGKSIKCDHLITCTGIRPFSDLLLDLSPQSVSPSGYILVNESLQIQDEKYTNVYSLGDVAETGSPKMASAAMAQAPIVRENILRAINKRKPIPYVSHIFENTIDLILGMKKSTMYLTDGHGSELLFNKKNKNEALSADRAWKFFDAKLSDVKVEDEGNTVDN